MLGNGLNRCINGLWLVVRINLGDAFKPCVQNLVSALSAHYIQNYSNYEDVKGHTAANAKFGQSDLAKIDDYIQRNIGNAITIEALADLVFCSKYYFLREFKKSVGETPYQYITHHRIEQSKRLLLTSSLSLREIAHQMGFNDQSHLIACLNSTLGSRPNSLLCVKRQAAQVPGA